MEKLGLSQAEANSSTISQEYIKTENVEANNPPKTSIKCSVVKQTTYDNPSSIKMGKLPNTLMNIYIFNFYGAKQNSVQSSLSKEII